MAMKTLERSVGIALAAVLGSVLAGCGTPGAPLPPSLKLPDTVTDLAAMRAGNQVSLTWVMPKRNTDKLPLKGDVIVRVCRREAAGTCSPAGDLTLAPGAAGSFAEMLPPALAAGVPRPLLYFVELKNRNGRSAGMSNPSPVLAGEAPAPLTGLTAEVRKEGVVLHWNAARGAAAVRLHRKLLTPPPPKPQGGKLATAPEPVNQDFLVEPEAHREESGALDKNIAFGETYEYRAQRIARVTVGDRTVELAGALSDPLRVEANDVFPPAIPTGLVAVATAADSSNGTSASIDLSWQPGTESDLAGYEVYRREDMTPWRRISGTQPLAAPAFHDTQVMPGHTYRYGVSAVDAGGHESGRSVEVHETVPNP